MSANDYRSSGGLAIGRYKPVLLESSHGLIVPRKKEELGGVRRN